MGKNNRTLSVLTAISPIDGRYRSKVSLLSEYFSEYAIFKYRLLVEINYFLALAEKTRVMRRVKPKEKQWLTSLITNFDLNEAKGIKEIEEAIKHDVKAVEYYLKEKLEKTSLKDLQEMVHFGLTSDDINNLAYGMVLRESIEKSHLPQLSKLIRLLKRFALKYKSQPMLARTHGQPAVPTTLGKEITVFVKRLADEKRILSGLEIHGKLTGSVGNFNAHFAAYPEVDWMRFSQNFVSSLGLTPDLATTQIQPYDSWIRIFDVIRRINTILIGFSQDCWRYISDDYFLQKVVKKEVGSSTLPQKINPIHFENAEGVLGVANALLKFYSEKLLISRLQRDLSDSSVRRTFGEAFAYCLLGYQNLLEGLSRIRVNKSKLEQDLVENWQIVAEGIQSILRSIGYPKPYEVLKEFTRGKKLDQQKFEMFIDNLKVEKGIKKRLKKITPFSYLGLAEKLTESILKEV